MPDFYMMLIFCFSSPIVLRPYPFPMTNRKIICRIANLDMSQKLCPKAITQEFAKNQLKEFEINRYELKRGDTINHSFIKCRIVYIVR